MTTINDLSVELALARRQLHRAQSRLQAIEAQLGLASDPTLASVTNDYYIFDNLLEGCQIIDFDWRYRYLNDSAAHHAQRAKETLLGYTMMECYPGIETTGMFAMVQRCMVERTVANMANEFIYPDGSLAWFELKAIPIPSGLMIFSVDITARKRAEAAERESVDWARLALMAGNLGKWQHDFAAGIIRFDELARLQYGFAQDTVTLDMVLKQLHPEDVQRLGAEIAFALDPDNDGRYTAEYRVIHPDGSVHWLAVQAQVYFHGEGAARQPYAGFGTSQEITDRKVAQEALQRYTQRLEILHKIDLDIINATSIVEIMTGALKQIRLLFACEQASALLFDLAKNEAAILAMESTALSLLKEGDRYPMSSGLLEGFDARQVSVINDLAILPTTNNVYHRVRQDGMRSSLRALFSYHGEPLGMLVLNAATPQYFTPEQQHMAAQIASQLTVALQQRQLVDDLAQYVTTVEEMQHFLRAILDAFPANTAVLAPDGVILTVNQRWKAFAAANGAAAHIHYLGVNYLTVCDLAVGPLATEAAAVAAGIRAVIAGAQEEFSLEYPCHSALARWFMLRVTPLAGVAPRRVIVAHIDITERKVAENAGRKQRLLAEALRDSLAVLTTSVDIETMMQQILTYSAVVIPSEAGMILFYEGNQGRVAYLRGHSAAAEAFFRANTIPLDSSLYPNSDENQGYYLVADTATEPGWHTFPATAWVRSSLAVQIVVRGEPMGLLIVDSATAGRFQPEDVAHLQTFARYTALALEKAHYVNQLEALVRVRTGELQAAKERVEAILHHSADSILLIDTDLRIHQANAAFQQLVGWAPTEAADKTLRDIMATVEEVKAITHFIQTVIAEAKTGQIEFRGQRHDGVTFDAELSMGLINDNGLVCILRDITERKAQERQLRYHASLQENVSDAVIVTDLDRYIQGWNRAAERIYGWRAEEVIGKFGPALLQTQFASPAEQERNLRVIDEQGWWQGEVTQCTKDGRLRTLLGSLNVIKDANGAPVGLVAINYDITERKAIEQALQQSAAEIFDLYNNAPCGYQALDQDGVLVQINDTELRWLGYDRADVVGKLKFTDLLTVESKEIFFRNFPLFKEQGWIKDLEFEVVRKDGSTFFVLLSSAALYDENGQYLRSRSTLFDITDLRQARQALMESEARYRLLATNVKDVITKVSPHGIRLFVTPSCYGLLGYTPDELIGQAIFDLIDPDDRVVTQATMLQALNSGQASFAIEQRLRHKAGHYIWVEVTNNIVRDPATGEPLEIVGVIRDITERKRVEVLQEARSEEEGEFQQYLRALHEITIELTQIDDVDAFYHHTVALGRHYFKLDRLAIFIFDPTTGLACGAYGTDPQGNVVAEEQVQFTPAPDGLLNAAFVSVERFSFQENVPLFYNHQIVGYGWNVATVLWNGAERLGWLIADNLLTQKTATKPLLDILRLYALTVGTLLVQKQAQAALRESEQRYRLLAENITDLVMRTNAALEFAYVSPSSRHVLGYEPAELQGKVSLTYVHPDDWAITEQALIAASAQSMTDVGLVSRIRHKAGHYVWLEISGRAIRSGTTGKIEGFIASARDISDRKQAEIALRESEEKFRLLLDSAPIATVISDQRGRITLVNVQAEILFGFTRAELVGQTVELLVPEYARNTHRDDRMRYMATPRVRRMGLGMELFARRKDSTIFPVEIELGYIETKDGIMVMSFVVDITERKQVAAELERQRSFLQSVIDVSPSMIFVKDYDARFVLANPWVAKLYNTTVEALIGKTDADFHPSAQEVARFLASDRKVIETGEPLFIEEPITNIAGETRWLQTTKVPIISADGASKYVLGIARDVTEHKLAEAALKASEEKYRLLVETMRGGLMIFDLEDRITYVNDRFCELLGYSREELIGTLSYNYVKPTSAEEINIHLEQSRNSASSSYEIAVKRKDGQTIYLLVSGSPLFDKHGEYQGSFAVTTDITVQKQAEETLRLALGKEKELGELKSRFISMASHEFRTPLATILALTETVKAYRHKLSDEQIQQRLNRIMEQIDHLKDIMEDVLLVAQMQARRAQFNPIVLDLDALCRTILDEFQHRTDVKHRLVYHSSPGDYTLELDPKLTRQIISNLLSNAIKYSSPQKPVQIILAHRDNDCILQVRDEGIGIPAADLPHLFEPFHRAGNVGTISGTGLGLVITKETVELHNGTITVESQVDQGTTFTVHLPIKR